MVSVGLPLMQRSLRTIESRGRLTTMLVLPEGAEILVGLATETAMLVLPESAEIVVGLVTETAMLVLPESAEILVGLATETAMLILPESAEIVVGLVTEIPREPPATPVARETKGPIRLLAFWMPTTTA